VRVIKPTEITSTTQFSRASTATYYDLNGIIQTAAIDEIRLNYNPDTLESEGILIEDAATNLFTYSQEFDNAIWAKTRANVTANAITAPDGTLTADKLYLDTTAANTHFIARSLTLPATPHAFSVYAKKGELNWLTIFNAQTSSIAYFNLNSGVVGTVSIGSATIQVLQDGWFRCSLIHTPSGVANSYRFFLAEGDADTNFATADGVSGLYIWGAQIEESSSSSSYITTVAATVTRSADILGDMVTSSVAEPDLTATPPEALWVAATNYAIDDIVIRTTTHKKYQNIQAGVNATLPEVDAALDTPTRWIEIGSTNRYAMFDTLRNTQTITTSPLSVVLGVGERVNSIGILAMEADTITITVDNDYQEIYSFTQDLNDREVLDWYDFFFEPFSTIPSVVKFDLPPYTNGKVTVTISSTTTGQVSCGALVIGNYVDLGQVQYGARISGTNFSRIDREFDGTALLTRRQTKPKISGQTFFDKSQSNKILALKSLLNAVPTVWSGLDDSNTDDYFNGLLILGIYKVFDVDVQYPQNALLDFELEEI
jgi:hypothetical protein